MAVTVPAQGVEHPPRCLATKKINSLINSFTGMNLFKGIAGWLLLTVKSVISGYKHFPGIPPSTIPQKRFIPVKLFINEFNF